jgi:glycosyltransferase involved in cell wall biosynthesis
MPTISIIVPNYNHEPYLERRIKSILEQTYQDFELILLDDYSTDNSRQIIEKYRGHSKVSHIVLNNQNSGNTFKQWMKGFELAKGEFIWIAESDDWAEPTFLAELIHPLLDNQNIGISFCQTLCVDASHTILYKTNPNRLYSIIPGQEFVSVRMFYGNSIMNASMAVFRKSLLKNIEWSFTDMKFCGDWFFWVQLALTGKVFESGKYLNYFFKHSHDVTSKASTQGLFFVEGYKIMLYIKEKVKISKQRYNINLDNLILYYIAQKPNFQDKGVEKEALVSLTLVDKHIPNLLSRRLLKIKYKQLLAKFLYI